MPGSANSGASAASGIERRRLSDVGAASRPCDADLAHARVCGQHAGDLFAPRRHPRRDKARSRDRLGREPQDARELHQRYMRVVAEEGCRRDRRPRQRPGRSRAAGRAAHAVLHDDARPARGERLRETDELQRVAQPLLRARRAACGPAASAPSQRGPCHWCALGARTRARGGANRIRAILRRIPDARAAPSARFQCACANPGSSASAWRNASMASSSRFSACSARPRLLQATACSGRRSSARRYSAIASSVRSAAASARPRLLWNSASPGTAATAALQQRQRFVDAAALVERDAEEMRRHRMRRRTRQRLTVAGLGAVEVAALMRREGIAHERIGVGPRGAAVRSARAERAMAVLVFPAAAARARIVAAASMSVARRCARPGRASPALPRDRASPRGCAARSRARHPIDPSRCSCAGAGAAAASGRSRRRKSARAPRSRPARPCGRN